MLDSVKEEDLSGVAEPTLDSLTCTYEWYHENTKLRRRSHQFVASEDDPNVSLNNRAQELQTAESESSVTVGGKQYQAAVRQSLPRSVSSLESSDLAEVLQERRSERSYEDATVSLEDLAALLQLTYGWNEKRTTQTAEFRHVPSAGRLYPLEMYVALPTTDEGRYIWHYEPNDHSLARIRHVSTADVLDGLAENRSSLPPVTAFLTAVLPRLRWKYGERAYRLALIEAGHAGQNFQLAATALGLKSCPFVSFYDDAVHDLIGLDGVSEVALYGFFAGH